MKRYYFITIMLLNFININFIHADDILKTIPIIGAVTDNSASIVFSTNNTIKGAVQLSKDSLFKYILNFPFEDNKYLIKINMEKLEANTPYFYRITNDKEQTIFQSSFTTFPKTNTNSNFSFAFGSCINLPYSDTIFSTMQQHNPKFFIQIGDWIYPNRKLFTTSDTTKFYAIDNTKNIEQSYYLRYSLPNFSTLQHQIPIDYIYDDEDFIKDDCSKYSYTKIIKQNTTVTFKEIQYNEYLKSNVIQAYQQYFPNYPIQSEQSAYHSFTYGNAEFFVLDTRGTRSANTEIFQPTKKGKYKYKMTKNHQLLDSTQLNWLLNELKNSTATWKFIVSSVAYNPKLKKLLDLCMMKINQNRKLPNGKTGMEVAIELSALWCAFPNTNKILIDFIQNNHIKNVVVLSGDAHTALVENDKKSTLPELMAGALAQENSELGYILEKQLNLKVYNKGQGINNKNFNNAFGNVKVFGNDSIQLQAIDENNQILFTTTLHNGILPSKFNYRKNSKITFGDKTKSFFKMIGIYLRNRKSLK
ncbi:MAG: alkaline phosphatase D family protein [Chitinophagales bacterium]|nr:alkaline phosphatase D family protein [Chitinophagales bacterium]